MLFLLSPVSPALLVAADMVDLGWHQKGARVCEGRDKALWSALSPCWCLSPPHALISLICLVSRTSEWELSLSYTYTVMSLDGSTCLGCVYVMPPEKAGFDAQVIYWARSGQPTPAGTASLTAHLGDALEAWLASDAWPFKRVAWPGRKIPWAEWAALPAPGGA